MQRAQYQLANADNSYLRTHSLRESIRIRIHSATIGRAHNHLRCTAQIFHGGVQLGKTLSVPLTATRSMRVEGNHRTAVVIDCASHSSDSFVFLHSLHAAQTVYRAEFNCWLQHDDVTYRNLPRAARIIFKLFSKNNHPAGWCGMPMFGFDHAVRTGRIQLRLWPSECPTPNATSLQVIACCGKPFNLCFVVSLLSTHSHGNVWLVEHVR